MGRGGEGGREKEGGGGGRGRHVLNWEGGCGEVGMGDNSETNQVGNVVLLHYVCCKPTASLTDL